MEEDLSILIADLSGYTAMTEAHGSEKAADVIDHYVDIVNESLVGDSHLHERTGDEILIVSSSADHLALTATILLHNAFHKTHFLQLHGGLHKGKILKRHNSFFGSPLNLTARIASKADPGTLLCSTDFFNALSEKNRAVFTIKGTYGFKNVINEIELYESFAISEKTFFIDPVCRMLVENNAIPHPTEPGLFFCSHGCLNLYIVK